MKCHFWTCCQNFTGFTGRLVSIQASEELMCVRSVPGAVLPQPCFNSSSQQASETNPFYTIFIVFLAPRSVMDKRVLGGAKLTRPSESSQFPVMWGQMWDRRRWEADVRARATALLGSRAHAGLCPLSISCRDGIRCVRDAIGESAFEED